MIDALLAIARDMVVAVLLGSSLLLAAIACASALLGAHAREAVERMKRQHDSELRD